MKKNLKNKSAAVPKVDPYLEGLVGRLLDRLVSLEKKVDLVIAAQAPAVSSEHQPPRRDRTLYEAICADCSKVCEVPFKPVDGRAVYCKECYAKRKSGASKHGMPILTPVALPPKPVSRLGLAAAIASPVRETPKKTKKNPIKKIKKKK